MNRRVKIAILIAFIGVLAVLALQALWLSTAYKSEQKKLVQLATKLADEVVHTTITDDSYKWFTLIKKQYGDDIKPYIGGVGHDDSIATIKVYNVKTKQYDKYTRKCTGPEIVKFGLGAYMLYHVCGLNMDHFKTKLDSVFHLHNIAIPYVVEKLDVSTGKVFETTNPDLTNTDYTVVCDTIQLGISGNDGLVVKFDGSYSGLFAQIRFIIFSSFVITLLAAVILFGIIQIVVYQQKLSDFRENFVRHMIHEIKNPIVYLKRAMELTGLDDERTLRTAGQKIEIINLLIEKLLSTTSNKLKIQRQRIDLRTVLDNIRTSYPDADIRTEIPPELTQIVADPLHYANALLNLVDNAIKYSPGEKRVLIRCYRDRHFVCVAVRDWGVGVPLEYQPLLFDRYFRVPQKKSVDVSGFGLGLSYVKMVARSHGGGISFESIYRQGSEFTLRIPYEKT